MRSCLRHVYLSFVAACLCASFFAQAARADCADPPGVTGQIIYNDTHNIFQGCRADNEWVMLGASAGTGGGGGGNDNLGNHIASQNLVMGVHNITGTGNATMGSFSGSGATLTNLNAGNFSSGTVAPARLGSGTANSTTYLRGDGVWAAVSGDNLGNHTATQNLAMGTYNITGTGNATMGSFSGSGATLTNLNAGNFSSGTVAPARLGSGTANSTTYLRGDGTWAAASGDNLGNHTATQNLAMGTYNITGTGNATMGSFNGSGATLTNLNAGNFSSGTVAPARLGSGTANGTTYLRGDGTWVAASGDGLGNHGATQDLIMGSYNITGTGNILGGVYTGSGANVTNLNASNFTEGVVAPARLGSGTANANTYLRGDRVWVEIPNVPTCAAGSGLVSTGSGWNCKPDACTTGAVGTVCWDGSFYIGLMGTTRIYAAPADQSGTYLWKTANTNSPGTASATDGFANTYAMNTTAHQAARTCATKAPAGTWYLPAKNELALIWTNRTNINLSGKGFNTTGTYYWSSTQENSGNSAARRFSNGGTDDPSKAGNNLLVRCVRQ